MARDKPRMNRAIKTLEAKGLIDRRDFPDDARASPLALTRKGHATVRELSTPLLALPLTEDQRMALKDILGSI